MSRAATAVRLPSGMLLALLALALPAVVAVTTLLVVAGGAEGQGVEIVAAVARGFMYVGVLLAAGGTAFLVLVHDRHPPDARPLTRLVTMAALFGAAATIAGVPIQAAEITGAGPDGMTDTVALEHVLSSGFGNSALVRLAGLTLLLVGVSRLWAPWASVLGIAGALVALASFLLTGHTATTEPRWLVVGANYAHTMTGAAWFGGLTLLAMALRGRRLAGDANGGARIVARFSMLALVSVTALFVAGTALAWAEVRSLAALTATGYGWTLLAKVTVVALVVAIGAYNNLRLVPAVRRGAGDAWTILSRTVRAEVVGVITVLGVTAVLVNQVPARNFIPPEPVDVVADLGDDHTVNLVVDPATPGNNEIHLYLFDEHGDVADVADEVTLRLVPPDAHAAPTEVEPTPAGPGHFFHSGTELAVPGEWTIAVEVVAGSERPSAEFEVAVADSVAGGHGADPGGGHGDEHERMDEEEAEEMAD